MNIPAALLTAMTAATLASITLKPAPEIEPPVEVPQVVEVEEVEETVEVEEHVQVEEVTPIDISLLEDCPPCGRG